MTNQPTSHFTVAAPSATPTFSRTIKKHPKRAFTSNSFMPDITNVPTQINRAIARADNSNSAASPPPTGRRLGGAALGRALGLTRQAIYQWAKVPSEHVLKVERITGVSRHRLRPDLYPEQGA